MRGQYASYWNAILCGNVFTGIRLFAGGGGMGMSKGRGCICLVPGPFWRVGMSRGLDMSRGSGYSGGGWRGWVCSGGSRIFMRGTNSWIYCINTIVADPGFLRWVVGRSVRKGMGGVANLPVLSSFERAHQ